MTLSQLVFRLQQRMPCSSRPRHSWSKAARLARLGREVVAAAVLVALVLLVLREWLVYRQPVRPDQQEAAVRKAVKGPQGPRARRVTKVKLVQRAHKGLREALDRQARKDLKAAQDQQE